MRGVNQSERSFIYSMNEREPAMNGNQLARICREARYIFNWPSDGSTATPMAQLSSTTLIEDSLFSPVSIDTSMSPVSATPPALRTIGKRPVPKLFGVQMITSFCPGTNYAAACDVERNRNAQSYDIRESAYV